MPEIIYPSHPFKIAYRHDTKTFLLTLPIKTRYFDGLSDEEIRDLITASAVYQATTSSSPNLKLARKLFSGKRALVQGLRNVVDVLTVQYAHTYSRLVTTLLTQGRSTGVWIEQITSPSSFGSKHNREWYVVLESHDKEKLCDIMLNHALVPRLVKIRIGPMNAAIVERMKLIRFDAYPIIFRNRPLVIPGGEENRLVMMQLLQTAVSKRIEHNMCAAYVGQFTENSSNVVYERCAGKNVPGKSLIAVHADSLKFDFDNQQITADITFLQTASAEDDKIWLMYANAQSAYQFIPRVELVEDFKTGEILDVKIRAIDMIKKEK